MFTSQVSVAMSVDGQQALTRLEVQVVLIPLRVLMKHLSWLLQPVVALNLEVPLGR